MVFSIFVFEAVLSYPLKANVSAWYCGRSFPSFDGTAYFTFRSQSYGKENSWRSTGSMAYAQP